MAYLGAIARSTYAVATTLLAVIAVASSATTLRKQSDSNGAGLMSNGMEAYAVIVIGHVGASLVSLERVVSLQ